MNRRHFLRRAGFAVEAITGQTLVGAEPGNGVADPLDLPSAHAELADRVRFAPHASAALRVSQPLAERPSNPVRSVMRQFTSELFDKPWFNDREQWTHYLSMLAAQRFNRFDL